MLRFVMLSYANGKIKEKNKWFLATVVALLATGWQLVGNWLATSLGKVTGQVVALVLWRGAAKPRGNSGN